MAAEIQDQHVRLPPAGLGDGGQLGGAVRRGDHAAGTKNVFQLAIGRPNEFDI